MSADVKVGQVRRPPPRRADGRWFYSVPPIKIVGAVDERRFWVRHGADTWVAHAEDIALWPLWPSEHEQWKNANGYEVKR